MAARMVSYPRAADGSGDITQASDIRVELGLRSAMRHAPSPIKAQARSQDT